MTQKKQPSQLLTIEQIKHKLQDRRLEVVALATGLHYNTLRYIRDTKQTNVQYATLQKLSDYFACDCVCDWFTTTKGI